MAFAAQGPNNLVALFRSYEHATSAVDFYQLREVPGGFVNLTPYVAGAAMSALLSYGPKFMLPRDVSVVDVVEDFGRLHTYLRRQYGILDPTQVFLELFHRHQSEVEALFRGQHPDSVQQALRHAISETHQFFRIHKDVSIVQSDKGNKTCIMLTTAYEEKMNIYVARCLNKGAYIYSNDTAIKTAIIAFLHLRRDMKAAIFTEPWSSQLPKQLYDNFMNLPLSTVNVPILYGTVKCHKEDAPMRPICSTLKWISKPAQKILLDVFKKYFGSRLCPQNVIRVDDVCRDIALLKPKPGFVFVKYDVVDMYGSIPNDKLVQMVKAFLGHSTIEENAILPSTILLRLLHFIMDTSCLVSYKGTVYKQVCGLPQGGSASGFLATLYLDTILQLHNEELFKSHKVIKWFKYMDDILVYMPARYIQDLKYSLERLTGFKFDVEEEDLVEGGFLHDVGVIRTMSFLDLQISTLNNGEILTHQYRKPTSSDRMINGLSNTLDTYKENTIRAFLRTILRRSANRFLLHDINRLYERILNNNYSVALLDYIFKEVLKAELCDLRLGNCFLPMDVIGRRNRIKLITQYVSTLHIGSAQLIQEIRGRSITNSISGEVVFPFRSISMSRIIGFGCMYGGIPLPTHSRGQGGLAFQEFFANRRLAAAVDSVAHDRRRFVAGLLTCIQCRMVFVISGRTNLVMIAEGELNRVGSAVYEHQVNFGHIISPVVQQLRTMSNTDISYTNVIYQALFNAMGVRCDNRVMLSQLPVYIRGILGYLQGLGADDDEEEGEAPDLQPLLYAEPMLAELMLPQPKVLVPGSGLDTVATLPIPATASRVGSPSPSVVGVPNGIAKTPPLSTKPAVDAEPSIDYSPLRIGTDDDTIDETIRAVDLQSLLYQFPNSPGGEGHNMSATEGGGASMVSAEVPFSLPAMLPNEQGSGGVAE